MTKAVRQEDSFGCGLACVASVTNNSYKEARRKYFRDIGRVKTFGLLCRDLVKGLELADRKYDYKHIKRSERFRENTIVFIRRSKRYPSGHYLVKTSKGWMDPWINFSLRNIDVRRAKAGFRKRLPDKPIYAVFPV